MLQEAPTRTDAVPFDSGSGGSRVTYTSGQAAFGAGCDLRDKLTALAAELFEGAADRIQLRSGYFSMDGDSRRAISIKELVARASAGGQKTVRGEMDYTSTPAEITSYCAQIAEVTVDPDTGQVKVEKIVTVHDVGTILNPLSHQGQVEGGVIQGLGYALTEEMQTEDGHISTLSLGDYKIPNIGDVPELVTVLLEPAPGPAPYESKGIGESSNTPVAAAIANAVFDAVGVRIMDLPITAEKVFHALQAKQGN